MLRPLYYVMSIALAVITLSGAVDDGLLGYWSFNDGKGNSPVDLSAKKSHGTFTGKPSWVEGKIGGALYFNGKEAGVTVFVEDEFLRQGAEDKPFTFSAWVKPDGEQTGGERIIIGKPGYHAGLMANSENGVNTFGFAIWSPQGGAGKLNVKTEPLPFDRWYHLAAVYADRELTLYVDGKKAASAKLAGEMRKYPNLIAIGGIGKNTFKGIVDEVRVHIRALAPGEIAALMNDLSVADTSGVAVASAVKKISLEKDRPVLAKPVFSGKPVIAHYMTTLNMASEALWLLDPVQYRPDGPTGNIGGAARYRVLSGHYLSNKTREEVIEYELRTAKRLGIDGFHFYYQYFESGAGGEQQAENNNEMIKSFFKVLDRINIDFKLTLCLSHPNLPETSAVKIASWSRRIRTLYNATKDSTHWLRAPDGRVVFFTWSTEGLADGVKNTADLFTKKDIEVNMKALAEAYDSLADAVGVNAAFVYHLSASEHMRVASKGKDVGDIGDFFRRYVNAVFDYFPAGAGFADVVTPDEDKDWNYIIDTARKRQRSYGQAVLTDFYDSKVFSKDKKQMFHFERDIRKLSVKDVMTWYIPLAGAVSFRGLLERAATNDASFISYVTWNDYPEGHHLAPEINHNFAYSLLLQYYKNIWRKSPQTVKGDVAFAFYRKYPHNAVPSLYTIELQVPYWHIPPDVRDMMIPAQDIIDAAAILELPAELWVNGKKRADAPAGFSSVQIPMETGPVNVEIKRGGKTVVEMRPPEWITDKPYRTDRFTYGFSSRCNDMYKELFGELPPFVSDEYAEVDGVPNWKKRYKLP
ncbi:MAG: hypothetical protein HZC28_15790 [Spirochaetes bacterium]|nr:hypothetical protein [Spirochaetota bacterium]